MTIFKEYKEGLGSTIWIVSNYPNWATFDAWQWQDSKNLYMDILSRWKQIESKNTPQNGFPC